MAVRPGFSGQTRSMLAIRSTIPNRIPSSRMRSRTMSERSVGQSAKDKLWFFTSYEYNHEDDSIAYSAAAWHSSTHWRRWQRLARFQASPRSRCQARYRRHSGTATFELAWMAAVRPLTILLAVLTRPQPDRERSGGAGSIAFDRFRHAVELLQHPVEPSVFVQLPDGCLI